jgi:hypothetical protein
MDNLERELEELVDRHGLKTVVDRLASVCWEKAQHVQENWQDKALATRWNQAANRLETANCHMPVLP